MGVDVEDRQARVPGAERAQHRVGDRVVAAERDGPRAGVEQRRDARFDRRPRGRRALRQEQVPGIPEPGRPGEVPAVLGERVPGRRGERGTDRRRRLGRPAQERGAGVPGETDEPGRTGDIAPILAPRARRGARGGPRDGASGPTMRSSGGRGDPPHRGRSRFHRDQHAGRRAQGGAGGAGAGALARRRGGARRDRRRVLVRAGGRGAATTASSPRTTGCARSRSRRRAARSTTAPAASWSRTCPTYNLSLDRSRAARPRAPASLSRRAILDAAAGGARRRSSTRYRGVALFQPVLLAEGLTLDQVARFEVARARAPGVRGRRHAPPPLPARHPRGARPRLSRRGARPRSSRSRASALPLGDWVGRRGVERAYDRQPARRGRRARRGGRQPRASRSRSSAARSAGPAPRCHLTLDADLQQEAERLLEGQVGAVVALDPSERRDPRPGLRPRLRSQPVHAPARRSRTGSELIADPHHPLQNRALQSTYSPGSVFKIVIATAGLAEGVIDRRRAASSAAAARPSTAGASTAGRRAGTAAMTSRARSRTRATSTSTPSASGSASTGSRSTRARFDLGAPTGIDLEGEKPGLVPDDDVEPQRVRKHPWYPGETISVAIGQGALLTTPLQIATMVAAVANGGRLVTPHLVAGDAARPAPRPIDLPPGVLEPIRRGLWRVVNEPGGTGASARVPGVEIAGKTGTVAGRLAGGLPGPELAALGAAQPRLVRLLRAGRRTRAGRRRLRRARRPGLASRRADRQSCSMRGSSSQISAAAAAS